MALRQRPRPRRSRALNRSLSDAFGDYPNIQSGLRYAEEVVAGEIPAGQFVILACERQLRDLTRKRKWPYYFDPLEAERVATILQLFKHVKGPLARTRLILEPWQLFADTTVFGWRHKDTHFRRFHEAYECVPRKNGKSARSAARGLYMLALDGENGAEVFAGNISEKEADKIWLPAKAMAKSDPEFRKDCGVDVLAHSICTPFDGGKFDKLIGNPGDGDSPSCYLCDEYHQFKSDTQYETMKTGMGARDNWLIWICTTAGNTIGGPCYQYQQDIEAILSGAIKDEEKFGIIYGIDEGDDWEDPATVLKANPNAGVSVSERFLLTRQLEAQQSARLQNAFRTKHCNQWVGSRSAFFNMSKWRRCQNSQLKLEDFRGRRCVSILDLASKSDMAAYVKLFPHLSKGKINYTAFGKYYVPEDTVLEDINKRYQGWHDQGLLQLHPGAEIDFSFIREDVEADLALYQVDEVVYDPWRAVQLAQELGKCGAEMVEYHNKTQNMSEPMKELDAAIASHRFHFPYDPVLTWMAGNVTAYEDANHNVFPRKEGHRKMNKIDGIVATIMGIGRLMYRDDIGDIDDFIDNMVVSA